MVLFLDIFHYDLHSNKVNRDHLCLYSLLALPNVCLLSVFNGAYSQVSVHKISALQHYLSPEVNFTEFNGTCFQIHVAGLQSRYCSRRMDICKSTYNKLQYKPCGNIFHVSPQIVCVCGAGGAWLQKCDFCFELSIQF